MTLDRIRTRPITEDERAIVAGHEQMRAELADLRTRNERMRGFIQRLGYGHTDWPEQKIGCERPGPGCVSHCLSRCNNVDHLNATVYDLRADLDRLRAERASLADVVNTCLREAGIPRQARSADEDLRPLVEALLYRGNAVQADLDRLRAVWRAVAEETRVAGFDLPDAIRNAAVDAGLAGDGSGDIVTVLTPVGKRLARGGA